MLSCENSNFKIETQSIAICAGNFEIRRKYFSQSMKKKLSCKKM